MNNTDASDEKDMRMYTPTAHDEAMYCVVLQWMHAILLVVYPSSSSVAIIYHVPAEDPKTQLLAILLPLKPVVVSPSPLHCLLDADILIMMI